MEMRSILGMSGLRSARAHREIHLHLSTNADPLGTKVRRWSKIPCCHHCLSSFPSKVHFTPFSRKLLLKPIKDKQETNQTLAITLE